MHQSKRAPAFLAQHPSGIRQIAQKKMVCRGRHARWDARRPLQTLYLYRRLSRPFSDSIFRNILNLTLAKFHFSPTTIRAAGSGKIFPMGHFHPRFQFPQEGVQPQVSGRVALAGIRQDAARAGIHGPQLGRIQMEIQRRFRQGGPVLADGVGRKQIAVVVVLQPFLVVRQLHFQLVGVFPRRLRLLYGLRIEL